MVAVPSRARNWWIACTVIATVVAALLLRSFWAIPCGLAGGFLFMMRWYKPRPLRSEGLRPPFWKR